MPGEQLPEDVLQALFNAAPDAMLVVDANGRIVRANNQVEVLFDHRPDDLVGEQIEVLIPDRYHTAHVRHRAGYMAAPRARPMGANLKLFGRRRDGSEFPVEISLSPLASDEGTWVMAAVRDVSDRRAAEASLEHFAAIVRHSDDAIIGKTPDGTIVSWNPGAEHMYGYTAEEAIGRNIDILAPADRKNEIPRLLERIQAGQAIEHYQTVRTRKDGTQVPVTLTISPIKDASGNVVGASTIARDVTEQKRAQEALEASEARFRSLFEDAPIAYFTVDPDGRIMDANAQSTTLTGWSRRHLVGSRVLDLYAPGSTGRPRAAELFDRVMEGETIRQEEVKIVRPDGSRRWISLSVTPIKDRRGRVVQSRSAAIDITQTKRLERERREALEQRLEVERLREVNQFRTRLLNTAAHELNTPITPIMLQLHMLKKGHFGELTEGQERSVERLDRNMSRLASLVKDVLDVARLEAGKLKVSPEPTDLSGLLRETGASFATVAAEAGITMHVDAGDAIWVLADGGRISQVLFNLLDNAIKYTDAGGEVSVEAHRVGDDVVCRVRDTGVGMTADQMERLFTPFTKVHDDVESAREGTGLGLYICRGIVKQHGGRIWVDSGGPGAGTAVSFSLPAASPDQDGEREPAETDVEAPGLAAT